MGKLFGDGILSLNPVKNVKAHKSLLFGDDATGDPAPAPAAVPEPRKIIQPRKQSTTGISLQGD